MNPLLRVESLQPGFDGDAILPPITAQLAAGNLMVVLGRSGSGKSTFLKTLLRQHAPVAGSFSLAPGVDATYVPQRHAFEGSAPFTSREIVETGLERGWSFLRPGNFAGVDAALQATDAMALASRQFSSLSEGEKQRILLARVLASQAQLVLMDEPTAAMDLLTEQNTMRLIRTLCDTRKISVVMVTHFVELGLRMADTVLLLDKDLQQVEYGSPDHVSGTEAFAHSFDRNHIQEHGV